LKEKLNWEKLLYPKYENWVYAWFNQYFLSSSKMHQANVG